MDININQSNIKILYPKLKESDQNNIVPTTSTSFVMLLCDCLATTIMSIRKFTKEKFSEFGIRFGQTFSDNVFVIM